MRSGKSAHKRQHVVHVLHVHQLEPLLGVLHAGPLRTHDVIGSGEQAFDGRLFSRYLTDLGNNIRHHSVLGGEHSNALARENGFAGTKRCNW